MTIDKKKINKILSNKMKQYMKRFMHYDQVGLIPGMQD